MAQYEGDVDLLLVEDDPADAELTLRVLRAEHIANKIVHVSDGAEALEFLFAQGSYAAREGANHPKVVLLDLRLPKVSGIEVLQKLKGDERTRAIPVIALTSSKEDRDVVETYQLGVNAYIQKPVDFDQFCDTVRTIGLFWLLINVPPKEAAVAAARRG